MPGRRGAPSKKIKKTVVQVNDDDGGGQDDEADDKRGQSGGLGFSSLPSEMIALILDQFSLADLKPLRLVNKSWKSAVHSVFDSRAVVVLNPVNLMKLKTKDNGMELSVSSVKLAFPLGEKWGTWGNFGKYRKRVLVLLEKTIVGGVGALEEVIVGELDAPLRTQKMFLRQVFSVCPDLKKCVDMDGRTLEVFVSHQEQKLIDQRQCDEVDGFLLLPPETKLKILEHLSLEDLKLVTLVNQAWHSAASTMMGKKAKLNLRSNSPCLDHMMVNEEKFWFNSFLIHFAPGRKNGQFSRFLEYQKKVINLLRTRAVGDGAGVEELTICEFHVNLSLQTEFLQELFTLCPNVKMLCIDRKDDLLGNCEELPVLEHCKTVKLVAGRKRTPLATGIVAATPNMERLILGKNAPDIPPGWGNLSSIEGAIKCPPQMGTFTSLLSRSFRAKELSCLILNNDSHHWRYRRAAVELLPMMTKYAESLEVLDIKLQNYESFTSDPDPAARRPVMKKLHTLSLLDTYPGYLRRGGFIFGDLRENGGRGPRMGLDTHFPVLHTLRFTIDQTRRASEVGYLLYFLQYFPPLVEGHQVFPNITTLELSWPNSEENFNLWRDWTRRAAIMFPNVKNNEHIDQWKAMQLETPDVLG